VPSVEQPATVDAFLAAAGDFLVAREAEHNLILGICSNIQLGIRPATDPVDFRVVRDAGQVVLAAIRTPPYNLVLSEVDQGDAVPALAENLAGSDQVGVLGPTGHAGSFAQHWCAEAGRTPILELRERIFRLTVVRPLPSPPPGQLRTAGPEDRDVVVAWFRAFASEALPASAPELPVDAIDRRIALGGVFLWDDGGPVSLTVVGSRTPNGARVGPVYTPPERRGQGYASACVAGASQVQLDAGRTFVFLFTDLANPTSNHIYQAIGYEPIRDIDSWRFEA
jgi:predicted GNAT family acetyltransferase